ncbi:hypothetical protein BSR56_02810 [Acinetobacter haemolyticus]|nr:hypothetical protein [Acinetobacter haemolyticus]ATZ66386.1 hypothetical protein BSR56_02810 [Acinetobacter haemolyticus]
MNKKQLTLKLSAIAISILLASCGGGGSKGYYNNDSGSNSGSGGNGGTGTDTGNGVVVPSSDSVFTVVTAEKPELLVSGDETEITVTLSEKSTGGALPEQGISLAIIDAEKYGVSFSPSKQTTDENGRAIFTITLVTSKLSTQAKADLLANGIQMNILNAKKEVVGTQSLKVVNEEQNTAVDLPNSENAFTQLKASKTALLLDGDQAELTVQLLHTLTGSAFESKAIKLQTANAEKYGISFSPNSKVTDESGYATFKMILDGTNLTPQAKTELLANGIEIQTLNAQNQVIRTHKVSVVKQEADKPLYDMLISSNKHQLSLKGDNAVITVRALDEKAGSLVGKTVSLQVLDYSINKVTIESASSVVTDAQGDARFTIRLPLTTGAAATDLKAVGINLVARITDENNVTTTKQINLPVVEGATATPVGNITFGNAAHLSKSADLIYYTENLSAQVVDVDGRPLNQQQRIKMKIDIVPSSAWTGRFITKAQIEAIRSQDLFNIDRNELIPLQDQKASLELQLIPLNNALNAADDDDKPVIQAQIDGINYQIAVIDGKASVVERRKTFINRFAIPDRQQVPCGTASNPQLATSLVDQNNQVLGTEYQYTTDISGKFDFKVNYQRRYAGWQEVKLTASTVVDGKEVISEMRYPLGYLGEDFSNPNYQPFDESPYGTGSCSYEKPWKEFLTP